MCVFLYHARPFLSAGVWRARAAYVQRDVRRGDSVCAGALRARCQMCYQNFSSRGRRQTRKTAYTNAFMSHARARVCIAVLSIRE